MLVFIDGRKAEIGTELLHKCRVHNNRVEAITEVRECFRSHDPMHDYVYTDTISLRSAKDFCDNILDMKQDAFNALLSQQGAQVEVLEIKSVEVREVLGHVERLEEEIRILKSYLSTILCRLGGE